MDSLPPDNRHACPICSPLDSRADERENFLHDDRGELGRGAELSLLFWGNRSAPSWPPPFKRPIVLSANAVPPCHTHVLGRGDRAGIKHANTIDISLIDVPAFRPRPCHQTADLRNHVVWRRGRHGHGHGKGSGTDHHYFFALKARRWIIPEISLAYFQARENDNDANTAGMLTMDEARLLASNFARLPKLLGRS